MAKLRFWLIPVILGLMLQLAYSPGQAATTYCLLSKNPSMEVKTSDSTVQIPLLFSPSSGVQHFTLQISYDPNYLILGSLDSTSIASSDKLFVAINPLIRQDGEEGPANMAMISACVGMNSNKDDLETWTPSGESFLTLPFTINKGVGSKVAAGRVTFVTIEGFVGQNLLQELSPTTVKINFVDQLYKVKIKPVISSGDSTSPWDGSPYIIRLWNADRTMERKTDSLTTTDFTEFDLPPGKTYWAVVESDGYRSELKKLDIAANQADGVEYTIALVKMKSRIALVRKINSSKKLELRFAYRNWNGQIGDWPQSTKLILHFFKPGDGATPTGQSVEFPADSNSVNYPGFIDPPQFKTDTSFGSSSIKHIFMTIDPESYYVKREANGGNTRYTISFKTTTDKPNYVDEFKTTVEVDVPTGTVDVTKASIAQVTNSFTGNEIKSVGSMTINGNFYVDTTTSRELSAEVNTSEISLNYLKGRQENYVDPNKLAVTRFNLAVELKPLQDKSDITIVSINFTDETGKSFEYDPPEDVKASAGPIVIEIPLHKGLQKYLQNTYPTFNSLSQEDQDKALDDIYAKWLITEQSQNPASPEYEAPGPNAPKRYGIYFQRIGKAPELFIPNTAHGERIELVYRNNLLFARVSAKHTSSWFTATEEEVAATTQPTTTTTAPSSSKKEADHWYECFINSIRLGFFRK